MVIAVLMTLAGIAVIAKAGYTMTAKKSYWSTVANRQQSVDDSIPPNRGNILSCDGQLLASSIPEYRLFVDFYPTCVRGEDADTAWSRKLNKMWADSIDYICEGLHHIFLDKSAETFKEELTAGFNGRKRHHPIWRGKVDFTTFKEVQELPIFKLPKNKGGFIAEPQKARRHPFGSLAERTIGSRDSARFGIELACDSALRGSYGIRHKQKVRNRQIYTTITPAVDGADVISTIDVGMQDLAEQALKEELDTRHALMGVAILMEVETGDVKAIVNLERSEDGLYSEAASINNALCHICEPGSVFKTASMLVALDDGVVDTTFMVNTNGGAINMHGAIMRDWRSGGFGTINFAKIMEQSSNTGVSVIIDKHYNAHPEKFVEGLYRVGIGEDLKLPIREYRAPRIRYPDFQTTNRALYWSKTTLPWMSIGYETQIAPINTVTFYNAIANNGRMVKPRFFKQIVKDGEIVKEYPVEVLKEQIAKPEAIKKMQTILEHVVSRGTGKRASSKQFLVAGKTGTAQVSDKDHKYSDPIKCYWLSFCGYFPADKPRYTCIVCVKNEGGPASGGLISGSVFLKIAEGVMAKDVRRLADKAHDAESNPIPDVKNGDVLAADYVLEQLGIKTHAAWLSDDGSHSPVWGQAARQADGVSLSQLDMDDRTMPDVTGMGARDAVFILEKRGLRVKLNGAGQVQSQSIPTGTELTEAMTCTLTLGN